jgi:hypothetical protein
LETTISFGLGLGLLGGFATKFVPVTTKAPVTASYVALVMVGTTALAVKQIAVNKSKSNMLLKLLLALFM